MCDAHRVLVVDDEPSLRALVAAALTDEGYAVATASNGAEALARVPDVDPCVIVLDLRMPMMDGWTFARTYYQHYDHRAHLIITTAEGQLRDLAALAPADVLPKPFDLDDFLATVDHWTKQHVAPSGPPTLPPR
jgi:CheY-like chemotaxis protein